MRSKEEAHDYRYFPEPDLLPVVIDESWIERVRAALPELPDAKRRRFREQYGLGAYDAALLTSTRALADYFEKAAAGGIAPKRVANWIQTEVLALLNARNLDIEASPLAPAALAGLLRLVESGTLSGKMAKDVFAAMAESGESAPEVVARLGLRQITGDASLRPVVERIVARHPAEVAKYRGGKTKLLGFFVGQVMRETRGQANPSELESLFRQILGEPDSTG